MQGAYADGFGARFVAARVAGEPVGLGNGSPEEETAEARSVGPEPGPALGVQAAGPLAGRGGGRVCDGVVRSLGVSKGLRGCVV